MGEVQHDLVLQISYTEGVAVAGNLKRKLCDAKYLCDPSPTVITGHADPVGHKYETIPVSSPTYNDEKERADFGVARVMLAELITSENPLPVHVSSIIERVFNTVVEISPGYDSRTSKAKQLLQLAAHRFGSIATLAKAIFAQLQEITHVGMSLVNFDGEEICYGRGGATKAAAGSVTTPTYYHKNREIPYKILLEMWEHGKVQKLLGLKGNSLVLNMCDTPANEGGFCLTLFDRGELTLSGSYPVPDEGVVKKLTQQSLLGQPIHLNGMGACGPRCCISIKQNELKLVRGQSLHSAQVGGYAYVVWGLGADGIALAAAGRKTIMPDSPLPHAPLLCAAALGPRFLPHLKSPYCSAVGAALEKTRTPDDMESIWEAFVTAHTGICDMFSPEELGWRTHEEAAHAMCQKTLGASIPDILGTSTVVASPSLVLEDCLPETVYCGPRASKALRNHGWDLGPVTDIEKYSTYGMANGRSLLHTMTAETYFRLLPAEAEQEVAVEGFTEKLRAVGAARLLV